MMSMSLPDILFRPDAFYQNVMNEKESLKIPALIVLIGGIIGSVSAYFVSGPTARMMDGISPGLGSITLVTALVLGFIGAFFSWTILAEIFLITSMMLRKELVVGLNREFIGSALAYSGLFVILFTSLLQKNRSTAPDTGMIILSLLSIVGIIAIIVSIILFLSNERYQRPLEFVGYGYLPQVIGSLLTLVAAFTYIPRVTVPVLTKAVLEDPSALQAAITALMHDPAMMEFTQITTLVSIVFILWSAHIWIFGIKHARGLSPRDAAICVGVPIVLYVLYLTYNLGVM
jgi:hypothetical protein